MNQYESISSLKDKAKDFLTGNFKNAVMLIMAYNIVSFVFSYFFDTVFIQIGKSITNASASNIVSPGINLELSLTLTGLQYVVNLLCTILTGVLSTGMTLYFLNTVNRQSASVYDLFYGFQNCFKKSIILSAVTSLVHAVCLLPFNVCMWMYQLNIAGNWLVYMIIALLIGLLIYVPVSLSLSQVFFLLLDFPDYSVKEILQASIRLMKGRKRKLFLIQLSFIPLAILGALSLGIGTLWITPYMNMALTLYYLDIMKPSS